MKPFYLVPDCRFVLGLTLYTYRWKWTKYELLPTEDGFDMRPLEPASWVPAKRWRRVLFHLVTALEL